MFLLWKVCSSFCGLCCRDCSYGWYGFWSQIFGFPCHSIWSKLHLMTHLCFSWDGYFCHGDLFTGCSCMMLVCDHWLCIVRSGSIRDLIECGCFSLLKSHRFGALQEQYEKADSLALRNLTLLFSHLFSFSLVSRWVSHASVSAHEVHWELSAWHMDQWWMTIHPTSRN